MFNNFAAIPNIHLLPKHCNNLSSSKIHPNSYKYQVSSINFRSNQFNTLLPNLSILKTQNQHNRHEWTSTPKYINSRSTSVAPISRLQPPCTTSFMMLRVSSKIGKTENGSPTIAAFSTAFTGVFAQKITQTALCTLSIVIPLTDASDTAFRNANNPCSKDCKPIYYSQSNQK